MKRNRSSRVTLLALTLVTACAPARRDARSDAEGPAPGAPPAPAAVRAPMPAGGNKLVIALDQEPDKLNPGVNAMLVSTLICNGIHGYFVKYDDKMELVPDVITEVPTLENGGISADYLTYTYHLRPGIKWHDGVPFTSADCKYTVEAILDTRHEVESRQGWDKLAAKGVETPDDLTVVFHLKQVYSRFVEDTFFDEPIMPKHVLEKYEGNDWNSAPYHRAPIGLGPFKFKEWVPGSHVTVTAYDDYFRGRPAIDEITFRFIRDSNALLVALQAGEIEGYDNGGTDQYAPLKKIPWVEPYLVPQLMWEHVDMNTEDPILKDVRVRQAIQLAIDRDEISKQVYDGLWPPAHGDVFPGLKQWYNPEVETIVRFDPIAAGKLLDDAGWTMGPDGYRVRAGQRLTVSITTTAGRQQRELTEQVLQQRLKQVGIELTIKNVSPTVLFAPYEQDGTLKRGHFQLGMYAWIASPDPDRWTDYYSTQVPPPEGQNFPRYRNPHLDQLMDDGLATLDYAKRKAIYDEAQRIVATDVPMTPLVWRAEVAPMTKRLKNFKPNATQTGNTWNMYEWKLE